MRLSDFDFDLPQELIAQFPEERRDQSKLLIANSKKIETFFQLPKYLKKGDVLVFNNSKVINAKLQLPKGQSFIYVNLNRPIAKNTWLGFARPSKKLEIGDRFSFDQHELIITNKHSFGEIEIEFKLEENTTIFEFLDIYGQIPLPQYIKRNGNNLEDKERYQTVYGQVLGSVAAPTAGLHFTRELLDEIKNMGVQIEFVTLHVGAGTFLPVKVDNITEHRMHSEWFSISQNTAFNINKAKSENRKVIAVGTTALRALESNVVDELLIAGDTETNIFIIPGYDFKIVDALITNFHLPKSTLFMLVCAFYGYDKMHALYKYAIDSKLRFFSYGDAMFIEKGK